MLWWALVEVAFAGSGPWVVGDGGYTLFVGAEAQRLNRLAIQTADGDRDVLDVGEGLSTIGIKGIGTLGIGSRADFELSIPWYRVQANRDDAAICGVLGLTACETTQGIGIIRTRVKGLILNEFFGAPFSLSAALEAQFGQFTAPDRQRITNLGEGTFDLGPVANLGRTGGLGKGFYSGWVEAGFRYRVPTTDSYPNQRGDERAPGSEIFGGGELIVGPGTAFGIGPRLDGLWRPQGRNFGDLDLGDPDRLAALSIGFLRAGAVAIVRSQGIAASVSYTQTLYAVNNPTDTFVLSLGIQFDGRLPGATDG